MAFIQACKEGNVDRIREFSIDDIDPGCEDENGMTGLMHACERGHFAAVKCLVEEYEADVPFNEYDEYASAFERACLNNRIEIVAYIAERPPNGRNRLNTALHIVCKNSEISVDVLRFLVETCDVDVNALNVRGETCLMVARESYEKVRFLVTETDIDVNATCNSGMTTLMKICRHAHFNISDEFPSIRCLVEEGKADVNIQNKYGSTALGLLVTAFEPFPVLPIVRYLVESCHADVNARQDDRTILMRAVAHGSKEVVRYLAGVCKIDANAADLRGTTLLMLAASRGMYDFTRHLVETCHADVNAENDEGRTALMLAARFHRRSAKYLLTETNADAHARDSEGNTVLMYAAKGWNYSIVKFLVKRRRADPTCRNEDGDNAFRLAQWRFKHQRWGSTRGFRTLDYLLRLEGRWPRVPPIWKGG